MIYSMTGKTGMNFNNLTVEGYTAFILAIIFSIVTIAAFIFFARHKEIGKMTTILITLIFPALAIFCWVYLLMNIFSWTLAMSLYVSLGTSLGYVVLALCIAYITVGIINAKKKRAEKKAELEKNKPVEEPKIEEKTEDENPTAPLLLTDSTENNEENQEIEEEQISENQEIDQESQPVEETEETSEQEVAETEIEDKEENTEETSDEDEDDEETTEQGVVFANGPRRSFAELFSEQTEEIQASYNEIIDYAMTKPKAKCHNSKYHVAVKIGRMKLLLAKFAKETLVCNFMAGSSELKNYSMQEKSVKIKEKPVIIEIESADSVTVSKNMIDIVYKNIQEAIATKKALRKAKKNAKNETQENVEQTIENETNQVETKQNTESENSEQE